MTVYITQPDVMIGKSTKECVLIADTPEELFDAAGKLKLPRRMFEQEPKPHFPISRLRFDEAVRHGFDQITATGLKQLFEYRFYKGSKFHRAWVAYLAKNDPLAEDA